MSFKRKGPGVLVSTVIGTLAGAAIVGGAMVIFTLPALAQGNSAAQVSGEFERPYGYGYGKEQAAYDANTRDASGNRVIVDGRIMTGMDQSSLSMSSASAGSWAQASAGAGFSSGTAIGNQLNVITQGSWNTVIVNATQINNGNQTTHTSQNSQNSQNTQTSQSGQATQSNALNGKIDLQ